MQDTGFHVCDTPPAEKRWRLVCHSCGFKFPPMSAGRHVCYTWMPPDLRIHCLAHPCDLCRDPVIP